MARGNNGNALQHVVELACAEHLLALGDGLRLLATHGMKPSEPLEDAANENFHTAKGGLAFTRLLRLGEQSRQMKLVTLPPLAQAFGALNVTTTDYPNSARLLLWAAERVGKGFAALVIETLPAAFVELNERWGTDQRFKLLNESWRNVRDGRDANGKPNSTLKLELPGQPSWPWVWSMDPYTYVTGHSGNPGSISDADIQSLAPSLKYALAGSAPGVFALFCYSMDATTTGRFKTSVESLYSSVSGDKVSLLFLGVEKDKGSAHWAALISNNRNTLSAADRSLRLATGAQFRACP